MSMICPTVLAKTVDEYYDQMNAISGFASRIQIDLGDGIFTAATVPIADVWWPKNIVADIHLMYQKPVKVLDELAPLHPDMVIIHAEADKARDALLKFSEHGIKIGIALLQKTDVSSVSHLISMCDHVLIFSGSLGHFGGKVDLSLLKKVDQIRNINPYIEIGWDGGINVESVKKLADGGVDVLNVGGAIQKANRPENAYRDLLRRL